MAGVFASSMQLMCSIRVRSYGVSSPFSVTFVNRSELYVIDNSIHYYGSTNILFQFLISMSNAAAEGIKTSSTSLLVTLVSRYIIHVMDASVLLCAGISGSQK